MRRAGILLLVSSALLATPGMAAAGQAAAVTRAVPRFAWPASREAAPAANLTPKSDIQTFVNAVAAGTGAPPLAVGDFTFAPLEPGALSLVATVDASGRGLYYTIAVISRAGGGFRYATLPSAGPHFLPAELLDLRGDGLDEIVTRNYPAGYAGARAAPVYWYEIYSLDAGKPKNISAQFPAFYRATVLPQIRYLNDLFGWMKHSLPAGEMSGFHPGTPDLELAEIGFVRLKYQHVVLGNGNAGLAEALGWAVSPNPEIAVLGVRSLAEMTAPQAWDAIHKLWNSPNYAVCMQARGAWLKKQGTPFTLKYECPRPGARRP